MHKSDFAFGVFAGVFFSLGVAAVTLALSPPKQLPPAPAPLPTGRFVVLEKRELLAFYSPSTKQFLSMPTTVLLDTSTGERCLPPDVTRMPALAEDLRTSLPACRVAGQ